jgi:CheY-like chemotaxis protein
MPRFQSRRRSTPSGAETPEYAGPVLLIDDDLGFLDSLAALLQSHGFRVVTANNGKQGLQMFRAHAPAVVVTDIMMPEQDGIGTMLQMRRERPGVKIIAISGGGKVDRGDYLVIAEQLGADAAIPKTDASALINALDAMARREP